MKRSRVHNFSAGPAQLPLEVLEEVRDEFINYQNIGSSIIEISHRDKTFVDLANEIETELRKLLHLDDDHEVIFMQGGATLQFSLIPLNFIKKKGKASYAEVGSWSSKAIKEASKICDVDICFSAKMNNFTEIDGFDKWKIHEDSQLIHYCKNETIQGINIKEDPDFNIPVFVDMSSCLFSENTDFSKYDFIYACAQKNFGASGLSLIIVKKELLSTANPDLPNILNIKSHSEARSMLNTPNTFSWYLAGKIFKWYIKQGGIKEMEKKAKIKSEILYTLIDESDFYHNPVKESQRSHNNIVFTIHDNSLEYKFLKESEAVGLMYLKGHRSVGGMRASIYNSMEKSSVQELANFMKDFEQKNG
tara:strand:+ start:3702 stop:4787 length:1086 start_codon:yes stop_codon:yes gene_type:complete